MLRYLLILILTAPVVLAQEEEPREYAPGIHVRVYDIGEGMSRLLPLVEGQTPNVNSIVKRLDLADADFGLEDNFVTLVTARFEVETAGTHRFRLTSDDGSHLTIDGTVVIDHDGLHGMETAEGSIELTAGAHQLEVYHFEAGGGAGLRLAWQPPGLEEFAVIDDRVLSVPAGVVRVTSPGRKRVVRRGAGIAPGDGVPLESVHPSYDLLTVRPEDFAPKVGGMDFLSDGRLVVCCWEPRGRVFIVDGVSGEDRGGVTVKELASGLAEPLGLKVVDDRIFVLQKQELTELVDRDGDDVVDEFRCVCDDWTVSSNFHEFAFGLEEDGGWLYFNLAIAIDPGGRSTRPQVADRGRSARVEIATGKLEFLTRGLRTPNGIGKGPFGEIYITDNQGDWLPSSKVMVLKPGAFYEQRVALPEGWKEIPATPPVVWLPQNEIGNSPGQPALFRGGPFDGQLAVGEVTHGGVKRVFVEKFGGVYQGALFRFTQGLEAGINRLVIRDNGDIFVGGIGSTGNWQHEGRQWYGLQRLRPNGEVAFEMKAVRAYREGFVVELTEPLAEGMGETVEEYTCRTWRYVPTEEYGGPKIDLKEVVPDAVAVSDDRLFLYVDVDVPAGHVFHLRLSPHFRSNRSKGLWSSETWYTKNVDVTREWSWPETPKTTAVHNTLSPFEMATGWELLFDGENPVGLVGFKSETFPTEGWEIVDGTIVHRAGEGGGDIVTRETYVDFEFRCDWKVAPGGNSGIMYRVSDEGWATYSTGPEMQILDDVLHADGGNPLTSAGALYGLIPCRRPAVRPAGQWNHAVVRVLDGRVTHRLNGVEVVRYRWDEEPIQELIKKSKFAEWKGFAKQPRGRVALQDHGDEVTFRNLKIRRM